MNIGIYRLVFNASRGVWMAVSEHVRSHQSGKSVTKTSRRKQTKQRATLYILLLGITAASSLNIAYADAILPVNTIPTGLQVTSGNITIQTPTVNPTNINGRLLNINQSSLKGIMQGTNFNIGNASAVNLNHTGGNGSATLIRINGPKSVIEGALNSPNGKVYLINQNGILFGDGARVNVGGLVASALDMKDTDFLSQLGDFNAINDGLRPAYVWGGDGSQFQEVLVQVEPDANIKAALGGSVMLFAPKVINQGSIETTEGQVVMAGGDKVYLSVAPQLVDATSGGSYVYAKDSPYRALAGVLVEVDSYKKKDTDADTVPAEITGAVVNDTMGRILAQRGNITMAGFMVNQDGRATATSSVSQKGSIRLLARDTFDKDNVFNPIDSRKNLDIEKTTTEPVATLVNGKLPNGQEPLTYSDLVKKVAGSDDRAENIYIGSRTGKLNVGKDSITTVLSEDSAALAKAVETFAASQVGEPLVKVGEKSYVTKVLEAVNVKSGTVTEDQIFSAPTIEAVGRQVTIGDNAKIVVPGGFVNIAAQKNGAGFNYDNLASYDTESRLFMGNNSYIDVAGLKNVSIDMERNFVELLLTQTDLKDDPLNRNGFLNRKKVWFDIRNTPDSKVADLAGFVKQVPRSLGEKLATGGSVKIQSEGDLIQNSSSKIDVSGGSLLYNTGVNKETWLVAQSGRTYRLGDAPVDTVFTGFLGGKNSFETQESGYTEGKSAGNLEVNAVNLALDGQLTGGATYGERQRESTNLGGKLAVNLLTPAASFGTTRDINISSTTPSEINFNSNDVLPESRKDTVELNSTMLNKSSFEDIALKTSGAVKVNADLNLANGAKFSTSNGTFKANEINKSITAHGGKIDVGIAKIADGVKLDASGNWVNDTLGGSLNRVMINGGTVNLTLGDEMGKNTLVDVSGGGWLQRSKKLVKGDAGSIAIDANQFPSGLLTSDVELRGYALGVGGNLSISGSNLTIGSTALGKPNELLINSEFFQKGGFTSYNLKGADVLVRSDANVDVIAKNFVLDPNFALQTTGETLYDFASTTFLPDYLRSSTSLALSSTLGSLVVETGSTLKVDANGLRKDLSGHGLAPTIALKASNNQLFVDGTLSAAGGDISLKMDGGPFVENDPGYSATQAIWLGSNAKLLAGGYTRKVPNKDGLRKGEVYDGGSVHIDAKKGYIVAETGSTIDVSGTSTILDIKDINQKYTPTIMASNGGNISISAREGMLLDATYKASSPGGLAGSLALQLTRGGAIPSANPGSPAYPGTQPTDFLPDGYLPNQLWYLDISQAGTFVPNSLNVGDSVEPVAAGLAKIAANNIQNAGFADVSLLSEHGVRFFGDVDLTSSRSLNLNARVIEATADSKIKLSAPNVVLSNQQIGNITTATTPIEGEASLNVNANLLSLVGQFALSGFGTSNLNSLGDIRLTGVSSSASSTKGELLTTGSLSFNARQIYPTTLSDFAVSVSGTGSTVNFNKLNMNDSYDKVLSAGGKLTVNAETINQNGVLLSPFGTIALNATDTLNLNAGSVTSVSAEGALIPFGFTSRAGLDYLYDNGAGVQAFKAPPERQVKLSAPNVNQNTDSEVNISGGGDLFAYEWIPGLGGSKDVLANGANQSVFGKGTTDTWAIFPANKNTFASFDPQYWQGSTVKAGDAVYISGAPGLAAGYYTLLPARYALLPGAVLVSSVAGNQDRVAGQSLTLANGSTLVSGHLAAYTSNGYTQTTRTGGFVVRPGTDAKKLAQYNTTTASTFFKDNTQSQQTLDSGRLSIAATNSLVLNGIVEAIPQQGGRGAELDIAAPKLLVVDAGQATGQVTLDGKTYLAVDETTLANFNVASLLLGGRRSNGQLDVTSSEVRIGNNASISGPEVTLAATDRVNLDNGARVTGVGAGSIAKDLTIGALADENGLGASDGDGALLRVSGAKTGRIKRINTDSDRGDLILGAGSVLDGNGALQIDATKNIALNGDLEFGQGAALTLSANRVSLGSPDNNESVSDGLWLKKSQLDQFVDAGSLELNSKSSVDLYGDVAFGNNQFDLTIQGAGLAGYQNAGKVATINAKSITFSNNENAIFTSAPALANGTVPTLGNGQLNINSEKLVLGNNTVRLAGYDQIDISATKETVAQGKAPLDANGLSPNKLAADNNLTINTANLTATQKTNHVIEAGAGELKNGLLKIQGTQGVQPANLSEESSQGAKLKFSADKVLIAGGVTDINNTSEKHAANIVLKGGQVTVEATGASASDSVIVERGAGINVKGTSFVLNDQTIDLSAGKVALSSLNGDVEVNAGARIDVSASGSGDAGKFEVTALNGTSKINAVIKAADSDAKGKNATSNIVAKVIGDFGQTIANLASFSGSQSYRTLEGDITISATDKIVANNVKIEASSGTVLVNGTIDASGDKGGKVEIYAKNNATIAAGAQILAKGLADKTSIAGNLGNGGQVIVSSDTGLVSTAVPVNGVGGALIDVSGDQVGAIKGDGGKVTFRAARTGTDAGNGVNVQSTVGSAVMGAKQVNVEAVKKYDLTSVGSAQQSIIRTDNDTFLANVASLTDLNQTPSLLTDDVYVMNGFSNTRDGKSVIATPGVEVSSVNNLTISSNWLLGEKPGALTLKAGNNLIINGNIDALGANTSPSPQSTNAWSYRLVAGADANSVNPESVVQGVGNVTLRNATVVRTGTGAITVAAGKDLQLGSEGAAGSAIYTRGVETGDPQGFTRLTNQAREFYGNSGGDVTIKLGGDLNGSETAAGRQNVREWFTHALSSDSTATNSQVRWWSRDQSTATGPFRTAGFTNGVGALGGGDVSISAGGNVANLQVVSATNARMGGNSNSNPDLANFIEQGGGDVNLKSGGSINKTLLHAGNGVVNANAGANLSTELSILNAKVNLQATDNLEITATNNPTTLNPNITTNANRVTFYSYTDETSVSAISSSGNVNVTGNLPSKLYLASAGGDLNASDIVMFPSSTGSATLLAAKDTFINNFVMSDVNPESLPGITTPNIRSLPVSALALNNYNGFSGHTPGLLHLNNTEPVRIYAGNDVVFSKEPLPGSVNRSVAAPVVSPKRVVIKAGNDVLDANLIIQNNKSTDISIVEAGNNIRYSESDLNANGTFLSNTSSIQIAGPGRLHVVAGKDIDLGTSSGILSIGNTSTTFNNPFLPEQGADIFIQPGATAVADYNGILNAYVETDSKYSSTYLPKLTKFMQQRTGNNDLSATDALADFKLLDRESQTAFINDVFYSELKAGGLDALNLKESLGDYTRSERAILTMFPSFAKTQTTASLLAKPGSIMSDFAKIADEEITHPGDLSLFYSQVKSERGGRIELLVPGGFINAGLEVSGGVAKPDAELGIVSLRGGELLGFVRGDFQVNQSRVFTLGGSNLMLYSALEDIDAGKGAKTASSTPPPVIRIVNGQVVFDFSGAVTGSGIAALTSTGGKPGDVDLFAPYGEINAGEAGIRSAGNINLGARVVVGADNISAGGVTTGAPAPSTAGLSVTAPAAANAAANAGTQDNPISDTAKDSSNTKLAAMPSVISVEVISLGDESTPIDKQETKTKK